MIHVGDCRTILPTLENGSVQTCVTSPPYWGLRDYGTATWDGGDAACDHKGMALASSSSSLAGYSSESVKIRTNSMPFRDACGKCGAKRIDSQIGLEATPEEYVEKLVGVFRLVRDVLADDGTLWLNIGDSYSGGGPHHGTNNTGKSGTNRGSVTGVDRVSVPGIKPKDLVGIPWMVAFALRADGWYWRAEIIWHKPNVMPESVTDRPTKAHEVVLLLSKQPSYFYDADAIREPDKGTDHWRAVTDGQPSLEPSGGLRGPHNGIRTPHGRNGTGRNKRSVWTIPTQPTSDAHFATFPEALVAPCILAGSRSGDTVLDPFFGSGTVGKVAEQHGRRWIGIELNPSYCEIGKRKTAQRGLFMDAA